MMTIDELKREGEAVVARCAEMMQTAIPGSTAAMGEQPENAAEDGSDQDEVEAFAERAEARQAARVDARAAAPPATPAAPVAAPTPLASSLTSESAQSINALAAIDLRELELPAPVVDVLESNGLMVPSQMSEEEQAGLLGAIGGTSALLFLLPLVEMGLLENLAVSTLVGGGLAAYAALRKDSIGAVVRSSGQAANKAVATSYLKAKEYDDEYKVVERAKERTASTIRQAAERLKSLGKDVVG